MREQLIERSLSELKLLFVEETKALIAALESGAAWEDLKYLRDRTKDITSLIDRRSGLSEKIVFGKV
jgi:hypothetical protein